jgi:hypothetical protein
MRKLSRLLAAAAVTVVAVAGTMLAVGRPVPSRTAVVRGHAAGRLDHDGFNVPGGYRVDLWQKLVAAGTGSTSSVSQFNGPAGLGDHDHEGHSGWTIAQIDAPTR